MAMADEKYTKFTDVVKRLGVNKSTLYYYIRILHLEKHKFLLDKHVYLSVEDVDKIESLRNKANERAGKKVEDDNNAN